MKRVPVENTEVEMPDDWEITVRHEGYIAWAHSPDEQFGVSEWGETAEEAARNLRKRMREWFQSGGFS